MLTKSLQEKPKSKQKDKSDKTVTEFSKAQLTALASIAKDVTQELFNEYKTKHAVQSRLRSICIVLYSVNPELKQLLLEGSLTPAEFATMPEQDMAPKEIQEKIRKQVEYQLDAKRTDLIKKMI